MKVIINYPKNKDCNQLFLNNLATFKAELLLKSIDNLKFEDNIKDKILKKILEILNDMPNDTFI